MQKSKLIFSSIVVLFSAFALSACGNSSNSSSSSTSNTPASSSQQHMSWMVNGELTTLDLSKVQDAPSFAQLNNVMEGLYYLGKNAVPKPALATSTQVSKNQKIWTFTLNKNAKWSNGDPITAQDFVYSWQRTVNPKTASAYSYLFAGIKNANAIVAGKKKVSTLGIKAVGQHKLVVTLDKKIPYFKILLTFPTFFPQSEKAVKNYGSKYGTASKYMVYDGPFVQKGWTGSNLSWKLVKNPEYWDKKDVKMNKITFSVQKSPSTSYNLYQTHQLDATYLNAQASKQWKNKTGYTVRHPAQTDYLQFNMKKNKLFKNKNFRYAISKAINKKQLAKTLGGAFEPANTFTAKNMTKVHGKDFATLAQDTATKNATSYDVKAAKQYYQKALHETGKKKANFTILSADDDTSKNAAEYVQSQLETNLPNLSVRVQSIPDKAHLNRINTGNFDCTLSAWIADFADPISFLDCETSGNSYNYGKWSNTKYDKIIKQSKTISSSSQRMHLLEKAENILMKQQGITPLVQPGEAWLINPKVKNVIYNGAGIDYNFKYAYISK